ncbi:MAG: M48 family metallopeptidase [Chloroflexi bacterium]|nr:M48 family metallopeptidase [Chloroflexota bacterium]
MARQPGPEPVIMRRVPDGGGHTLEVEVTPDRRLRRNARWTVADTIIQVRVPLNIPAHALDVVLDEIVEEVLAHRARARKLNDDDLERRAQELNETYFDGELRWHTIRWVSNINYSLGTVTEGGASDGDIRISDKIKLWPQWVIDYVIAHELAHRKHPNHSAEFWAYLGRYPLTERARGFIEGVRFVEGAPLSRRSKRKR